MQSNKDHIEMSLKESASHGYYNLGPNRATEGKSQFHAERTIIETNLEPTYAHIDEDGRIFEVVGKLIGEEKRDRDYEIMKCGDDPQSLIYSNTQTKLVLEERERIETQVEGLQFRVKQGLKKLEYLKRLAQIVEQHKVDIIRNKDFTYEVEEDSIVTHNLEPNTYVTNCLTCNFTCHSPCGISNDGEKYRRSAMDDGGKADAH
ncbi:hypothetical protein LOD99_11418 [Oopsacas minuta]|uniref:Uncharacterized protein n=1 Tax=Oopsacas minuta TaxID=111878 RepID=A0AAV7K2P1_9METZ|nr:hypothetical protein LOD99_11418 [Oopsacas minuta]